MHIQQTGAAQSFVGESEQIRRGILLWLQTKGVTPQKAKPERKRASTRKRS